MSSSRSSASLLLRAAAGLLAAGALALVSLLGAPAAWAHDRLTGSTPAAGSTVTAAPTQLRLTFTDEVANLGLAVLVTAPDGTSVVSGGPTAGPAGVLQPLLPLTLNGTYRVAYRVVSSDGHPVSGSFTFAARFAAASVRPSTEASAGSPSAVPGLSAVVSPSTGGTIFDPVRWALGGAVVALGGLVVGLLVMARRRAS